MDLVPTLFPDTVPLSAANNVITPKRGALSPSNNNIAQENSVVNSYDMQAQAQKNTVNDGGKVVANLSLFTPNDLSNFNTARKKVIDYAKNNFPKSVTNKETGMDIGISRVGMDKLLSGNILPEKYASAFHVPQLIENATQTAVAPYLKDKENIKGYSYFDTPILIGKRDFTAHIRVRETSMGHKYYGHTLSGVIDEIKIEPSARDYPDKSALHPVNAIDDSTSNTIIPQGNNSVNSYDMQGQAQKNTINDGGKVVANLSLFKVSQDAIAEKASSKELINKLKVSIPLMRDIPPVTKLTGTEFPKGEKKLTEQVGDFFRSIGNKVSRKGFGEVILDESGIQSDIAHGLGRAKSITFAAVPDIIKQGRQIDSQKNWKGRGYDSYVFSAPVEINGKKSFAAAVVISKDNNKFYLHEVVDGNGDVIYIKKEEPNIIKTGITVQDGLTSELGSPYNNNISQGNSVVNSYDMQTGGENARIEPVLQSSAYINKRGAYQVPRVQSTLGITSENELEFTPHNNNIAQGNNSVNSYDMQGQAQKNTVNDGGKVVANLSLFTPNDLSNFNTARKKVIDYAKNNFPKSVTNKETGMDIGISRVGMDKLLSGNILPEKYASAFHVPQLIENAQLVDTAPYTKGKQNILGYSYFDSPIIIGKKDFTAHIRVRKTNEGQKYYGHTLSGEIDEIKIEPSTRSDNEKSSSYPVQSSGSISNTIIPQGKSGVNSYDMQNSGENAGIEPTLQSSAKGKKYQARQERFFLNKIGEAMSIPKKAQKQNLAAVVSEISNELRTGTVSEARYNELFEKAYENGVLVLDDFYNQYKDLKEEIRNTSFAISESEATDIADFNYFRKANIGTFKIAKTGIPIDTKYQELSDIYPELFDNEITSQADQLQKISEVAKSIEKVETSLDGYYGEDAAEYKKYARHEFDTALEKLQEEIGIVNRFEAAEKKQETAAVPEYEMIKKLYESMKGKNGLEAVYNKAASSNLLTNADKQLVEVLLKGGIAVDEMPARPNKQAVIDVYNAKLPLYEAQKQIDLYNANIRKSLTDRAAELLDGSDFAKDKWQGFQYQLETQERNFIDVFGKEKGKELIAEYITPIHDDVAKKNKLLNESQSRFLGTLNKYERQYAQMIGELEYKDKIKDKSKQAREEYDGLIKTIHELYEAHGNKIDMKKAQAEAKTAQAIYEELFVLMNEVRIKNGYPPIEHREGYFPHFEDKGDSFLNEIAKIVGIEPDVSVLPTDIAGRTEDFKPGKVYTGFDKQRTGSKTDYDLYRGFDKYINLAGDVIFLTGDIKNLRALAEELRYKHSDEQAKIRVNELRNNENLSDEQRQDDINKILENGRGHLSQFAVNLDEYTNILANKQSHFDRTAEKSFSRSLLSGSSKVYNRVAANMVGMNLNSAMSNLIALFQSWGGVSTKSMLSAMLDTANFKHKDGLETKSTFLTNRAGHERMAKTTLDKVSNVASTPFKLVDDFVSGSVTRARYYDNVKRGMNEADAMADADKFSASVIADRSKGAMPTMFYAKNPLIRTLTMFQLEVNNQYRYLLKDLPREAKERGTNLFNAFAKYMFGAFLYNLIREAMGLQKNAFSPFDMMKDTIYDLMDEDINNSTKFLNAAKRVGEQVPLLGGFLGGGRTPISSALPNVAELAKLFNDDVPANKKWSIAAKEISKPAFNLLPPFGGGQVKKTIEGISTAAQGGSYTLNNQGERELQFPVEPQPPSFIAGALFGKMGNHSAQKWVDSGFKTLSSKQTTAFDLLKNNGSSAHSSFDTVNRIKDMDSVEEKRRGIVALEGISPAKKATLADLLTYGTKKKLEYENIEAYEFSLLSESQQEKYSNAQRIMPSLSKGQYTKYMNALKGVEGNRNAKGVFYRQNREF